MKTPQSNRLHVGIFGETNAGKSSLFNALVNTDISIVSEESSTTTDSVQKAMELLPFGPIVLIDTAGLNDSTTLGQKRLEKTKKIVERIDLALYVIDASKINASIAAYNEFAAMLKDRDIPHILAITKSDIPDSAADHQLTHAISVSIHESNTIDNLKQAMVRELSAIKDDAETLLGDLLPPGSTVVMVVPIDSAAPKGRLILPQVQLIRDCLDNGNMVHISTEKELPLMLANLKHVDLVVTDSQAFGQVSQIVPKEIKLTSFSILMARQKGDINTLLEGIKAVANLQNGDKILISEVCTHSRTHEDIGQVKIPAALRKLTGKELELEFTQGRDFPEDLHQYAMIIHCAGCMITPREMKNRIKTAKDAGVPITNYGLFLAHAAGVLERSVEIL